MIIRKIHALSLAKVLSAIYACLGLLFGAILSLVALVGSGFAGDISGPEAWLLGGGAVIVLPLAYGIFGFIGGLLVSVIYNFISGRVGGIEIEVD